MDKIINHDDIFESPVLNDSEIFDEKTILGLHAIFAVQESQNGLFGSVKVVDDWLGIVKSASRKNIDIVVLAHVGQKFKAIWSDIELEFVTFMVVGDICLLVLVKDWMYKRLIEVQDQKFFLRILINQNVPAGYGSLTPFFFMYSWEGPLRLLTE